MVLPARIEAIPLRTQTMGDADFLRGLPGTPATIAGVLRLPRVDTGPLPTVVLLHGSGGPLAYVEAWAQRLQALGWATFLVDSFSGRALTSVRDDQALLGRLAGVVDAYRALERLLRHPALDPARIVLMGFSRGGQAALYAAMRRFQRMHLQADRVFAAHIAFYPNCAIRYLEDTDVAAVPLRIHHGEADDFNPIQPCRDYVSRLRAAGHDAELLAYPDAHHVFDWPGFATPQRAPLAQSMRDLRIDEVRAGELIDAATGQPFDYGSSHVARGTTAAYQPEAAQAATRAVQDFLCRWTAPARS